MSSGANSPTKMEIPVRRGLILPQTCDTPADRVHGKRQVRRAQILEMLRSRGPMSRVEISRALGFNASTVSTMVDDIVAEGIATEERDKRPGLGRPPISVSLDPRAASAIGIDIGRTEVEATITDLVGNVIGHAETELPQLKDPEEFAGAVTDFTRNFLLQHVDSLPPVAGVGVAFPGRFYDYDQNVHPVRDAVERDLRSLLDVPLSVEADSRMLALGELWFGYEKDLKTFMVVQISNGLGSTLLLDRKLYLGARFNAGDIGHIQLGEPGIECFCGSSGCLENIASGSGIERLARRAGLEVEGRPARVHDVAQMAREGSEPARQIFTEFARGLARGVAVQLVIEDPEAVVLGGRLARYSDLFLDEFEKVMRSSVVGYHQNAKVLVTSLYENAVSLGSCACILNQIFGTAHITVESIV